METAVVSRAFVRVEGPDAEAYLQGQLSQDVVARPAGLSLLLEPTGKVCALLRYVRDGDDAFLLDTDTAAGDALVARLRRFLLRTKASIEPVEGLVCTRVFGGPQLPQAQVAPVWSDREPVPQEIVGFGVEDLPGAVPLDDEEHERRRIEAGVPVSGIDIGPDRIPAEAGAWVIEAAVSFTKGCYTGQELVARIDSRGGNVPRPLRVLRLDGRVEPGAEVLGGDGTAVGTVTSAAADLAMAPVARKVAPGAEIVVAGVAGTVLR
jgi:tRNA-modifying protein YgfZ